MSSAQAQYQRRYWVFALAEVSAIKPDIKRAYSTEPLITHNLRRFLRNCHETLRFVHQNLV